MLQTDAEKAQIYDAIFVGALHAMIVLRFVREAYRRTEAVFFVFTGV